jgi:asparagine synthase (glutamine-hydrolysing)
MSGIVGMFHRDGAPADLPLLHSLAHFLSYRGPDAREVWCDGPVAFGHTMLRTTQESLRERQPASLGGEFWITADVRLDCRADLEAMLDQAGCKVPGSAPDPELILHAYAAWGEKCVQHLRGDFSFAIWDARRKSLFCARDHFGIKPFYYAALGALLLFSNTLDCLRLHPDVSDELNDDAIADFLLFGLNCDPATTTFRDIRRLPPAHFLCVSPESTRLERYWSPPVDGRIRYRRVEEYVEHFGLLFLQAVADHLRTSPVGIWLSGGLDSSSLAATARELSANSAEPVDLRAYTVTGESSLPDRERDLARSVAESLRIPIRCLPMGELPLFERWDDPGICSPEPVDDPFFAASFDQYQAVAADCSVVFNGEGSDNLMYFQMWPYARDLLHRREWQRFFAEGLRYLRVRPFPWRGIRQRVQQLLGTDPHAPVFPRWLAPEFAQRLDLEARWRQCGRPHVDPAHPLLPKAHASLSLPQWTRMFELGDPGATRCPVEVRYPFLDLRIVNYLLALPPFPWAFQKTLLREAMAGRLPETVRRRPKTPFTDDPVVDQLRRPESAWVDHVQLSDEVGRYVNRSALGPLSTEKNSESALMAIRPLSLNFWLQSAQRVRYNLLSEVRNG